MVIILKMIYDELDERWDENGYDKENDTDLETEFTALFDDKKQGNKYIVRGYHRLWTGTYEVVNPRIYDSIKDAIIDSQDGFGICYTQVYEEKYGKLYFNTIHHDGTNRQEILQVSKNGMKLNHDKFNIIGRLLKRRDATKNVCLIKRLQKEEK